MHVADVVKISSEPKVIDVKNDKKMIVFSVAEDKGYSDGNGEWVDKTAWHECRLFRGSVSDKLLKLLQVGNTLYIQGDYLVDEKKTEETTYKNPYIIVENFKRVSTPKKKEE